MENFLVKLNSFLWGAPVLILLFAVGLLYAVKTRFFQFRHFKHIMKNTAGEMFKKVPQKGMEPLPLSRLFHPHWQDAWEPATFPALPPLSLWEVPAPYSGCGLSPCSAC